MAGAEYWQSAPSGWAAQATWRNETGRMAQRCGQCYRRADAHGPRRRADSGTIACKTRRQTGRPAQAAQTDAELARPIEEALEGGNGERVRALAQELSAPTSPILSSCWSPMRAAPDRRLGAAFPSEVLSELDETVRDQLLRDLPNDVLAKAVAELETDDAAYVLEDLAEPPEAGDPRPDAGRGPRRARAQPGISGGDRRPSDADGLRGGAAVLDRRPGDRSHARDRRPARDVLRHLCGRSRATTWWAAST